jgi:AcrR family transcriptional regulator
VVTELGGGQRREYTPAESEILAATEQLLGERSFHELSVSDIAHAAGISRTRFYVYFASKTAVVIECLHRFLNEVLAAVGPFISRPDASEAEIRESLERWMHICVRHGAVVRAVSEEWPHDEELRAVWFESLDWVTSRTAEALGSARSRDEAPGGADPKALAACLIWAYERVVHVALVGEATGLPDAEAVIEPLTQMVVGGLYGRSLRAGEGAATGRP